MENVIVKQRLCDQIDSFILFIECNWSPKPKYKLNQGHNIIDKNNIKAIYEIKIRNYKK
jgi:hypothetical protein